MKQLDRLPEEVVATYLSFPQRNEFLPVGLDNKTLTVWVLKERALPLADYMGWLLKYELCTEIVPDETFYPALEEALALWEEEHEQTAEDEGIDLTDAGQELLGWSHDDAPIVRLVNKTIQQAVSQGASDVHFEGE